MLRFIRTPLENMLCNDEILSFRDQLALIKKSKVSLVESAMSLIACVDLEMASRTIPILALTHEVDKLDAAIIRATDILHRVSLWSDSVLVGSLWIVSSTTILSKETTSWNSLYLTS